MKKLLFVLTVVMLLPSLAFALSLTVSATTTSGTNLGAQTVLKCKGYRFMSNPNINPFDTANCANMGAASTLSFGTLSTILQNADGTDSKNGAGCFYGRDFFMVFLYPDAWGGRGYELRQSAAGTIPAEIRYALVMTPGYSRDDKFAASDPTGQGDLNDFSLGITGEQLGDPVLAFDGGLILRAKRGRIVRAVYSLPPFPAAGQPNPVSNPNWKPVKLETPSGTYTSGVNGITIAITEF